MKPVVRDHYESMPSTHVLAILVCPLMCWRVGGSVLSIKKVKV